MKLPWTARILVGGIALGVVIGLFVSVTGGDLTSFDSSESGAVRGETRSLAAKSRIASPQSTAAGSHIAPSSGEPHQETDNFKHTVWGKTCAGVDANQRQQRDERISKLVAASPNTAPDPFSGTLASLYVDFRRDGRWHQLRLAVADADAQQRTASYKFVLAERAGPSPDSPFQFVPLAKLFNGFEGNFDQQAAEERWVSALALLKSDPDVEISTIRSRSFAGFFDGEAVEIENGRLALYDDSTFQCVGQSDGLPFQCSCTPDFALMD